MKDPNVSQLQILMSLTTPVLGKIRQVNFRKKIRGLVYYYNSKSGLRDKHSLSFVKTQAWPNLLVKEAQVEDVGVFTGKMALGREEVVCEYYIGFFSNSKTQKNGFEWRRTRLLGRQRMVPPFTELTFGYSLR